MARLTGPQQELFDALLAQHASRSKDLFLPDGYQRRSSPRADAFWAGYNGELKSPKSSDAESKIVWLAGKECRRRAGGRPLSPTGEKRSPRTIRLSESYWLSFRSLGSQWLECAIDREMAKRKRGGLTERQTHEEAGKAAQKVQSGR